MTPSKTSPDNPNKKVSQMNEIIWIIGGLGVFALVAGFCVKKGWPFAYMEEPAQENVPEENLEALTAELETVMAEAVRELDICNPYISRENWKELGEEELLKRQRARRMYIYAYEAWRKAEECADFNGSNGNIDLRMIGSIPLVRKAGIMKARQSIEQSKEVQNFLGLNS